MSIVYNPIGYLRFEAVIIDRIADPPVVIPGPSFLKCVLPALAH